MTSKKDTKTLNSPQPKVS